MKNLNYILVLLLFSSFTSCTDLLEEELETSFSEASVFSSEDDIESAINGIYINYSSFHGTDYHLLLNPHSGRFHSNQGSSEDATMMNTSPINTNLIRMWPRMYSAINSANYVIQNLEGKEDEFTNGKRALAEAHFLRGATYFDLARLFGGVPLRIKPTDLASLHLPKSSRDEVLELVISDLEIAKEGLPNVGENAVGKPTKYAANVFLAKLYMQKAGEDDGDPSFWQNAKDELLPVLGQFNLVPVYSDLFVLTNENTEESIFEIQYDIVGGIRNADLPRTYTPSNSLFAPENQRTFGRIKPNKEIFDQHVAQYEGDPRIDASYVYNSYDRAGGRDPQRIYPDRSNGNNGFTYLRKYFDATYNGISTSRNMIRLRYADVLLMMAEVENEINGPENAYQYVNEVMARARNTGSGTVDVPADYSGMSQDEFRARILKERQYELLGEGEDWFDSRRRGYQYFIDEIITKHNQNPTFSQGTDFVYPITVRNMLLPIPSTELNNNDALSQADQNPGY